MKNWKTTLAGAVPGLILFFIGVLQSIQSKPGQPIDWRDMLIGAGLTVLGYYAKQFNVSGVQRMLAVCLIGSLLCLSVPMAEARAKGGKAAQAQLSINPVPACPAVPAIPDIGPALKAVADSNLEGQVKATLMQQVVTMTQDQYKTQTALVKDICTMQMARSESKGKNWLSILTAIIGIGGSTVAAVFAGTR